MRRIINIACYETMYIFKDRKLRLLLLAVPLLYAAIFGLVYSAGVLTDIPLAIVDLDQSKLSREVVTAFQNSSHFKPVPSVTTYDQLEQAMRDGTVRAGIVIPEHFAQQAEQHRSTEIAGIYDASNLLWGYNTRKYLREVITDFNSHHTAAYLAGLGISQHQVQDIMNTVSLNYEVWYNPTFSYATYLYVGLLMMVLHQICLLSVSLTVTREKERNTWIQYLASPLPNWQIFMGKALPYFVVNYFNFSLLLWLAVRFVQVKFEGSLGLVLLLGLLYDAIITSLGFFISLHAPNSLQVTRYLMLLSVPIFITSGFTWPHTHIPLAVNALARLMPFTWMAESIRLVTVKNLPAAYLVNHLLVMAGMALVALTLAACFSKRRRPPVHDGVIVNSDTFYPGIK